MRTPDQTPVTMVVTFIGLLWFASLMEIAVLSGTIVAGLVLSGLARRA